MDLRALPWPRILLLALAVATVVGFFVYPTYPNYDSLYSLIWGREILHGHTPSFTAYRAPTEHPLAVAFGALMSLFGRSGDRLMIFATLGSFVALVAGIYRLAAAAFTPLVGLVAAALLLTRFDFAFLAVRGYIDIPYLAVVVWAAALEAERRRRGRPVFILLALASLLRPEAWLLIGLYWLYYNWPRTTTWATRAKTAALAAVGPVVWLIVDQLATGDALFSLHSTSTLADELGRAKGVSAVPHATWAFLVALDKKYVLIGAFAGLALAIMLVPRRLGMPTIMLVIGVATFGLVGVAGLSIINRYLLVPSLMVMIFAGVAVGGWTMLEPGGLVRRAWIGVSAGLIVFAAVWVGVNANLVHFTTELDFRTHYRAQLDKILSDPAVKAAERCGPISTPNHKLIPDIRWAEDLPENRVIARSDPRQRKRIRHGLALYVSNRVAVIHQAFTSTTDQPDIQVPLPGFRRIDTHGYYGAYERCPGQS